MRVLVASLLLCLAAIPTQPEAAYGDAGDGVPGSTLPPPQGEGEIEVDVENRTVSSAWNEAPIAVSVPPTAAHDGRVIWCIYSDVFATPEPGNTIELGEAEVLVAGSVYVRRCFLSENGGEPQMIVEEVIVWDPGDVGGPDVWDRPAINAYAIALLQPETPALLWAPPAEGLVVGVETWVGAPDGVLTDVRHAAAGPLVATAEAVPIAVTIDWGDSREGSVVTCELPLDEVDPAAEVGPGCLAYTYLFSSSNHETPDGVFEATYFVTYEVWLTERNNQAVPPVVPPVLVGTFDGDVEVQEVQVHELQAVLR